MTARDAQIMGLRMGKSTGVSALSSVPNDEGASPLGPRSISPKMKIRPDRAYSKSQGHFR